MAVAKEPLLRGTSHSEKLRKRLSTHAFDVADATESCISAEELFKTPLGRFFARFFGHAAVLQIVLPIFIEPTFRRKARRWMVIYLITMVLQAVLQVMTQNIELSVASSVEFMDGETFYHAFMCWIVLQAASLLRRAVKETARWEIRMMVQWRLQYRMGHSLFSANAFHHLLVNMFKMDDSTGMPSNPAPESLLCRDSFLWLQEFTGTIDTVITEVVATVTTVYTVSKWSYWVTLYLLLTVPFRGYLIMRVMPRPIFYMHKRLLETVWDLTFVMARVQDNSEQIALLKGGGAENWRFVSSLKILFRNSLKLAFFTGIHNLYVTLIGTAFMFPILTKLLYDVCDHGMSISAAMQYSWQVFFVNVHLSTLGSMSHLFVRYQQTVMNMVQLIEGGRWIEAGYKQREELGAKKDHFEKDKILVEQQDILELKGPAIDMRHVSLFAPRGLGGFLVLQNFSFQLQEGQSCLIVGDTGTGKSLLLRAIHGLWWGGCGRVSRCHNSQLSCMPERPFAYEGTLRQNLLYPEVEDNEVTDEKIMETLVSLNLKHLANKASLERKGPWHSILSLGQQQRLGFARIVLRPDVRLVLLDEATSALDMKNERNIYNMLRERIPSYVTVGHRPSVREYHTHVVSFTFNEDRSKCTSSAKFMPIGECDFSNTAIAGLKGSAEEKLWAERARKKAEKEAKEEERAVESKEEEEAENAERPKLPCMDRHWGGVGLVVRAMRDLVWPMMTQREIIVPVVVVFTTAYTLTYINLAMEMWFGYPYAQVINVMQTRSSAHCWQFFFRVIVVYYPVSTIMGLVSRFMVMTQMSVLRVALKWYLSKRYLDSKSDAYYHIALTRIVDGNPGTRIVTWDADQANMYIASLMTTLSSATFGVFISCRSLWGADKQAFLLFVLYILGGMLFYLFAGTQLFKAYMGWLDLTMSLHNSVLHAREHSESIALLQGSDFERRMAFEKMDKAITPGARYLWIRDAAGFGGSTYFTTFSDTVLHLFLGPAVISGRLSFYMQTQMRGIISAGSGGVHGLVQEMLLNAEGQAALERLWELLAIIKHIGQDGQSRFGGDLKLEEDPSMTSVVELRNVSLRTPVSKGNLTGALLLVKTVSLTVPAGDSLLIAGESGIGKSSMLRAVAGLWRHGSGAIRVTDKDKSFFIPQRPYFFVGNLRENLLYPDVERTDIDDEKLSEIVTRVGLQHLLSNPGLGEIRSAVEARADVQSEHDKGWVWRLSLGELQRLNFGRLLLREGLQLVFLDEATSALAIEAEEAMYEVVRQRAASFISVAHRPQLRRFHKRAFVMLTDHTAPAGAECRTACRLMSMEEYEAELEALAKGTPTATG